MDDPQKHPGATTFVTVLGWILISFTGLGVFSTLLQNMLFTIMLSMPDLHPHAMAALPPRLTFPFRMFLGLLLAFAVLTLASAIAFLKRMNWARRTFVMLFALAIGLNVVALVAVVLGGALSPPPAAARFDAIARLMLIPMGVGAVGFSILFGWLIKRLTSAAVRREFGGAAA